MIIKKNQPEAVEFLPHFATFSLPPPPGRQLLVGGATGGLLLLLCERIPGTCCERTCSGISLCLRRITFHAVCKSLSLSALTAVILIRLSILESSSLALMAVV